MSIISKSRELLNKLKSGYASYAGSSFVKSVDKNINQPIYNKVWNPLLSAGANIPRFEFSRQPITKYSPTVNKVAEFGRNIALGIPESFINIPRNLVVGQSRIQKEIADVANLRRPVNWQNVATGVAPLAEAGLDLASFGTAGSIAKSGGKELLKGGLKQAFKKGLVPGALYGGTGGAAYGVGNQYGKKFNVGEVATSTALGTILGGVIGGTISGIGALKQILKYPEGIKVQLRDAGGRYSPGEIPIKPPKMNKRVWDIQIAFNKKYGRNPYEMVTAEDLAKVSKFEAESRIGNQVRDINKTPFGTKPKDAQQPSLTTPIKTGLYDGPEQLRPLARNVVWGKMSKEQFLSEFNKGLKNQNLTVRETAQKTLSEIKKSGMTPESFYDRYGSSVARITELEKKMSRSTGNPQQYEAYRKEWDSLKSVFERTPEEMKVAQKALDESLNVAQRPLSVKGVTKGNLPQTELVPSTSKGKVSPTQTTTELTVPSDLSSVDIIPQKGKLNVENLGLDETGKKIVRASDTSTPTVIGNKDVVKTAKLTTGADRVMTDAEQQLILSKRLNSREKVVTLTNEFNQLKKSGADEKTLLSKFGEIADQSRIAQQEGTFAGRQLQAQKILADELATPQQKVLALLENAGVDKKKYLKEAINVDWKNGKQVVEFYRKFVSPKFGELLTEYRYVNMLSSPLTHIKNIASNFIQTGIVTPVEKTVTGGLDWVKSKLTGSERQYYVSDGIKYAKGYYKSLPQAWGKFKNIISGKEISIKPDMERVPVSTGKAYQAYSTPLRALEAADKFFMELVKGGETASMQGRGLKAGEIALRAENSAKYRLFRQAFDPDGKLGQGYVLKIWDKYNSVVNQLRRLPGGNWIVPFLQTPTNILKQGVEYSPFGITTMVGSKRPIEQLSKAIVGTGVFAATYGLLNSTEFTWEVPSGQKERDLFYAANMQPYSIKIGDKWVSYSKLGPLAYPIAMAASLRYAEKYNLPTEKENTISTALGGMMKFFADQSYVKQLGDLMDSVQTGKGIVGGLKMEGANAVSQLVPYRSFLGWLSRMIDPVSRKSSGFTSSIVSQIPFASKTLEPYYNPVTKQPSERSNRFLNSVSPVTITTGNKNIETMYKYTGSAKRAYSNIMALPPEKRRVIYQTLSVSNPEMLAAINKVAREVSSGITGEQKALSNLNVKDGERAYKIANEFKKLKTPQEKAALYKKYRDAGIITDEVQKQLNVLLSR